MPVYFYVLDVYDARPASDGGTIEAVKGSTRAGAAKMEYKFTSSNVTETAARNQFLTALYAYIDKNHHPFGLLDTAFKSAVAQSCLASTCGDATVGPWSQRIGKGQYAYFIGVATTGHSGARAAGTNHDLE